MIVVAFIIKNHTASSVLGEKSLSYQAAGTALPCKDADLTPGNPCVTQAIKTVVSSDNVDRNNLTKNLSKSFFTSYLNIQDPNGDVAEQDRINVIQNTIANAPTASPAMKYTLAGLIVFDPSSKDEIRAYGNDFASIYRARLSDYVSLNQPTYSQSADYYKGLAEALSRLKVPRPIAEIHVDLLNSYNQMYVSLLDLNNYENDPLKGFYALTTFRNNQNIVPTYLAKVANYFKSSGIIFSKSEPGSFWSDS